MTNNNKAPEFEFQTLFGYFTSCANVERFNAPLCGTEQRQCHIEQLTTS